MPGRWKLTLVLVLLVSTSSWLLYRLADEGTAREQLLRHNPDHYMENFTTTTMEEDGNIKNRLSADYMAHYPDNDTTELLRPKLEVFQQNKPPIFIIADKGWVTSDNEVILLTGAVKLWQDRSDGSRKMEIITTDVRILPDQEYAETDMPATFIDRRSTINATGVRAYFKDERVELLNNVQTIIQPDAGN